MVLTTRPRVVVVNIISYLPSPFIYINTSVKVPHHVTKMQHIILYSSLENVRLLKTYIDIYIYKQQTNNPMLIIMNELNNDVKTKKTIFCIN